PARQDVAEVAGRYGKRHLLLIRLGRSQVPLEVVDDLRHHPAPIDRVDTADAVALLELEVAGDTFDDVLAIVEHAFESNIKNICVSERIHLRALEFAHPSIRRQHEDIDA